MKEEYINKIVQALLNETILDEWYFYLLLFAVSLLGASFGSFIKSFWSEKAKYSAIESSLDTIKKQVSETTKTTEKIKQDIELNIWRKKDREMLKREKVEEYFSLILLSTETFHAEMENRLFNKDNKYDKQVYNKADLIQALYLPELAGVHNEFRKVFVEFRYWLSSCMEDIYERRKLGEVNITAKPELLDQYGEVIRKFNPVIIDITEKAKEVANQINT